MPAAAVIPALLVYAKVAAVKTLLLGDLGSLTKPVSDLCGVERLSGPGSSEPSPGYHD